MHEIIQKVYIKTGVCIDFEEFHNYFSFNIEKFTNIEIIREHWSVKSEDIKDPVNLRNWIFR